MDAPLVVYPVDWVARDAHDGSPRAHFLVSAFGRDDAGRAVAVHVRMPVAFLAFRAGASEQDYRLLIAEFASRHRAVAAMCTVVTRASAWGFTASERRPYAQLVFATHAQAKRARSALVRREGWSTFEAQVDPLLRLFHVRDVLPADWISVANARRLPPELCIARYVEAEYECWFDALSRCQAPPTAPPALVLASWDIECYSASGGFPSGSQPSDCIIQVAVSFKRYGETRPYRQLVLCLGETAPPADGAFEVCCFEDEAELLHAFFDALGDERVDVSIGYNIQQFDWRYIVDRAGVLVDDATGDPAVDTRSIGRIDPSRDPSAHAGDTDDFELSSGAYGDNKYVSIVAPGTLEIDLLQWFKRETKHESYS